MQNLLVILVWLTMGYVTSKFAEGRGRDPVAWFVFGILGGIFALAAVFLLPPLVKDEEEKEVEVVVVNKFEGIEESEWFYLGVDSKQVGPVEYRDLFLAWDDGVVKEDTFVWREGMLEWLKVEDVPLLLEKLRLDSVDAVETT